MNFRGRSARSSMKTAAESGSRPPTNQMFFSLQPMKLITLDALTGQVPQRHVLERLAGSANDRRAVNACHARCGAEGVALNLASLERNSSGIPLMRRTRHRIFARDV